MALTLVIGNKNYSSWSMRPWVLMKQLGIAFEERALRFDFSEGSEYRRTVAALSPSGLVPALIDDGVGVTVWDSLAIAEHLHERFPSLGVWPAALADRARARSLAAEMHSGFGPLRNHCPMNLEARLPEAGARVWAEQAAVRANVARIESAWGQALAASGGPFLFGAFGAVDAMYAPVCTRIVTYALPVSATTQAYIDRVLATPGVQAWTEGALAEHHFLDFDEPYRTHR